MPTSDDDLLREFIGQVKATGLEQQRKNLVDQVREDYISAAVSTMSAPPLVALEHVELNHQEVEIVREALLRGATPWQLASLVFRRRYGRMPVPRQYTVADDKDIGLRQPIVHTLMKTEDSEPFEILLKLLEPQINWYRDMVLREFESLPLHVNWSFMFPYKSDKYQHELAFDYYLSVRPAYYNAGYSRPAERIFSQIKSPKEGARLLGHEIIGGIHEVFLERLSRIQNVLEKWTPGKVNRISNQIKIVGGFVPRPIADTAELSNHAFGLAIDIDGTVTNPHIKNKLVIDVLKRRSNGIDFSQTLAEAASFDKYDIERIRQIHLKLLMAQEIFIPWLRRAIEREQELNAKIKDAQDSLPIAKTRSERDTAKQAIREAKLKLAQNEDVKDLQILRKYHPEEINRWKEQGILTIPLLLVVALKFLKFKWGGEYEESKDIMHFELEHRRIIPPDSPRRSGLDDL